MNEQQLKALERLSNAFHNNDKESAENVDLISAIATMAYQAMIDEEV